MVPTGNPFGFPGMPGSTPSFDPGTGNPVMQSLDMMRQVWGSLGSMAGAAPANPVAGLDELDKRITDLKAIENWLNLNLTMLRGSIQGLEVQRATISTLRSFAQNVSSAYAASPDAPGAAAAADLPPASPLEIVLGLRPAPGQPPAAAPAPSAPTAAEQGSESPVPPPLGQGADVPAANAWWGMLQDQFAKIATATAQAVPAADLSKQVAGARAVFEPGKAPDAAPRKPAARKAAAAKRGPAAKKAAPRRSRGSA